MRSRKPLRKPSTATEYIATQTMDFWIIAGVTMLVAWAWMTSTTTAPGWVHVLLTVGVFLVIWRVVVRGTTPPKR